VNLEDPVFLGWARPDGWTIIALAVCRGCSRGISWARTPSGRTAPLDRDGGSHFATCEDAERFRKRRALR